MSGVEVFPQVCNFKMGPVWGCSLNQVTSSSSPNKLKEFLLLCRAPGDTYFLMVQNAWLVLRGTSTVNTNRLCSQLSL